MTHTLKTDPAIYDAVYVGLKTFEIRLNDRDYRVGDRLILMRTEFTGAEMREGQPLVFTPKATCVKYISYILHGPIYGLADQWVILSLAAKEY